MRTTPQRGLKPLPSRLLSPERLSVHHFPHECALWKPSTLEKLPSGVNPSRLEVSDQHFELVGRFRCFYNATPETNQGEVMGRTQADNIFTMDKFILPQGVKVEDTWILVFLSEGDNQYRAFALQGEPQSVNPGPFHSLGGQLVMGKFIPILPPGVLLEDAKALPSVIVL